MDTAAGESALDVGISTADASVKKLDVEICAFGQDFSLDPDHPYFPLSVGSEWLLEGEEDDAEIVLLIEVLDETEDVGGVTTRVVRETEWEDDELLEISWNYIAGAEDGSVCYFGEDVDIFEDGEVSHEGAWRADEEGNFPGILMPAHIQPGVKFLMEGAPEIAEDEGKIVAIGPIEVPAGAFTETIRIQESNPLDGDFDFKVYAEGVGILVDGPLDLVDFTIGGG